MLIDFEDATVPGTLDADICIIGGGVAGLTIAREFIGTSHKVVVLEGGGRKDEVRSQRLYRADVIGMPHDGIHNGRFRVYGGSSTRWGAQFMTLTRRDFEQRDHVPHSGWPITQDDLSGYYDRALDIFDVNKLSFEEDLLQTLKLQPIPFNKEHFYYRFSKWAAFRRRNLAKTLGSEFAHSKNIDVYVHANVTEILPSQNGTQVNRIEVRSYSGKARVVNARAYIVCAGAIETARLLLSSRSVMPNGVGNENDLVGRYFQDHISVRVGQLQPADRRAFAATFDPFFKGATMHSPKLVMHEAAQQSLRCLNVMGHIVFGFTEESGLYELRRMLRAMQAKENPLPSPMGAWRILRYSHDIVRMVLGQTFARRRLSPKFAKCYLEVECEQAPNPDSRVMLSNEVDDIGMPKVILDWRLTRQEKHSVEQYFQLFRASWESAGHGTAEWNEALFSDEDAWMDACRDTYHHAGTTRMSGDPSTGVVDTNLRVHGMNNLYIASCSVFPTSGCANPTFTMMALCLRLTDHIKASLSS